MADLNTPAGTVSDLMEAKILRELLHPGIPLIYDLEEDETSFYVIEEYVRGENLAEFLSHQPLISEEFFYQISFALCDIFSYLHSRSHAPVLYRDLKPEHLLLCGSEIKLVDFNISAFVNSSENNLDHFGNLTFSAPESYSDRCLTTASDIYSIGKLLEYLLSHLEKKPSRKLRTLLQKATHVNPELRYETVEELSTALRAAKNQTRQTHLRQTIAVVGSHHGCGTTHLAIALVSFLNYSGISAVYYEKNSSDSLRNAAEAAGNLNEQNGLYHYRFFIGKPDYGPGIRLYPFAPDAQIIDCGTDPTMVPADCDLILLLTTGALWRRSDLIEQNEILQSTGIPIKLIGNLCFGQQIISLAAYMGRHIYHYPIHPDPFRVDRKLKKLFSHLLGLKKGRRRKCYLQEDDHVREIPLSSGSPGSDTTSE